ARAQQAVSTWAEIITARLKPGDDEPAWQREPRALHRTRFSGLGAVFFVGLSGQLGSMLPWLVVLEERRGHHFFIPIHMDALTAHSLLNLLAAVGGFLGGALGWILGTPFSLEFRVSGGLASVHRIVVACLAAALGSFFGLWFGYHHAADIGA